jgi:hypothetical protein
MIEQGIEMGISLLTSLAVKMDIIIACGHNQQLNIVHCCRFPNNIKIMVR